MAVTTPRAPLDAALAALVAGQNRDPFAVLGPHPDERGRGTSIRAFLPAARSVDLVLRPAAEVRSMERRDAAGVWETSVAASSTLDYRLRVTYPGDHVVEIDDP